MKLHRTLIVAVAAAACAVAPVAAPAAGDAVVAVNTRDASSVFRVSLKVRRVADEVVDTTNAAVAAASCTDCETVAISIQGVLMFDDPSVFTPENLAFALNVECTRCTTLASAYQFAIQTGGRVHLTADGNRRLAEVRHALHALRRQGLDIWELQARVDALASEVLDVLLTEVVAPNSRR
jgi:putative peptide zinc metalloprotease protein